MTSSEPPELGTSVSPTPVTGATPDGLPPLREVIAGYGLAAKKSLGQNFILDLNLTRRIARLAGPLEGVTVVEVGPGPGGLTRALLLEGAGQVIAIERDARCVPALEQISARYPGRLVVQSGDALAVDWRALLAGAGGGQDAQVRIVANLPYGIATRLLIDWLETEPWPPWFSGLTLMFQREVAERITASPGTGAYGRLAVIAQWRCEGSIAMTLKPEAFTPPPRVASAVVVLKPRQRPEPICNVRVLGRVTAAAFGQRRKMLRSALKTLTPRPEELLAAAGIEPTRRAEHLSVHEFATLAAIFEAARTGEGTGDGTGH